MSVLKANILSVRGGAATGSSVPRPWIFGVALDSEFEGHDRWIVESRDPALAEALRAAFLHKELVDIESDLLVDPLINAVE